MTTFADVLALPSRPADRRIAYGSDPSQFGDLRLPSTGAPPFPLVALIHGGCWESEYDLSHTDALATSIADLGVACWSLEYRRLGQAGGGWPGTFLDVAGGVDFIRTLAVSRLVDVSCVVLMGHSAGGHLALWAAARARVPAGSPLFAREPLAVRGVLSLAGISDLRAAYEQQVCDGSPGRLLGGGPAEFPDRYAEGSPFALLPLGAPQVLVHGSEDAIVPVAFSTAYAEAAGARGDAARAVIVDGAGHFDVISPASRAWPVVAGAIRELLA